MPDRLEWLSPTAPPSSDGSENPKRLEWLSKSEKPDSSISPPQEKSVSEAGESMLEKFGHTALRSIGGVMDIPRDIVEDAKSAYALAEKGRGRVKTGQDVGDIEETAVGYGSMALGDLGIVGAPLSGAVRAVVSDPIRKSGLPGSQTAATVADIAGGFIGPGGTAKAAKELPAIKRAIDTADSFAGEAIPNLAKAPVKPGIQQMRDAGYVVPPEMASEKPTAISKALSGSSGDVKIQQLASVKNQKLTNSLAATDLGLSPDTLLTRETLEAIRNEEGQAYKAVRNALPEITPTAKFKSEIKNFGGDSELLNKYFPKSSENKDVDALREEMRSMGAVPTDVIVDKIRVLRADATQNFKALGSPEKWRLAAAQRDAAAALEDMLDENLKHAPDYFARKIKEGDREIASATKDAEKAAADVKLATEKQESYTAQIANGRLAAAQKRLSDAQAAKDQNMTRLKASRDPKAPESKLVDRYRQARTRIAKTYDYEGALNPSNGEINAAGIAALAKKGKPLSGNAAVIAHAAQVAPKAMRPPASFGGAKDWSVLDFFGTMGALAHGNTAIAAGIAARPAARKLLLSDFYQNRMAPKSTLRTLGQPTAPDPNATSILNDLGGSPP